MAEYALGIGTDAALYLVMVLVMLLFNIWKGQIAGIAAVISFSCYGLLLNPDNIKKVLHLPDQLSYKARVLVGWISPLNQATFYMHNFGYDKLQHWDRLWQSALLYWQYC